MFFSFDTSKGETPASVARKRALVAQILGQIGNKSANNAGEGIGNALASIGQGISANVLNRRADKAEGQGTEGAGTLFNDLMGKIMGGGQSAPGAFPPAPMPAGGSSQTDYASGRVPQAHNPDASMISEGLVKRGMPKHVADAFVMNFKDESNLNPGINEANPIVPGSRGGFGLSQWTGPRRKALEAFAAQKGVAPSDAEMQLDFLMSELKGPEKAAAQAIMSAPDTGSAAAAIVNKFLRPAEEHRASREARYLRSGGGASMQPPMQMAQANTGAMSDAMPEMAGNAPQQPMQAPQGQPPQQNGAKLQMLMQAANNPWLNDQQRNMVNMMIKQEMEANDPNAGLENEYKRVQIDNMRSQIDERRNPDARKQFGLNPQYGVDAQGNPVLLQLGQDGTAQQTQMPEGVTLSKEPIKLDAGTHFVLLDPITRQPVGQIPKNVAGEAAASAGGKAQGEAQVALPQAEAGFQTAMEQIDQLRNHPGLESSVGTLQGQIPDSIAGMMNSDVADFRTRLGQAKGQTFLRAFESLKGGGVITEIEGLKAEQAMGRLNQAVSEEDFKAALDDLQGILGRGIEAYRRKAGAGGSYAAPQAPAGQSKRLKFNPETGELE